MCGLISIISKKPNGFTNKEIELFRLGLYASAVRGADATGCFLVDSIGNVQMIKDNIHSASFIQTKEYEQLESDTYMTGRILVGHCRSATTGKKTADNAHPFIHENIVLVHNGTLWHYNNLATTETDSEAITHALAKKPAEDLLPELMGAYALLWYNAEEKKFYASRNKDRPLWILQTPEYDLIASEPGLLEWIHSRSAIKKINALYFKTDTIYSWNIDKLKDSFKEVELKKKPFLLTKNTTQNISTNTSFHPGLNYNSIVTFHIEKRTCLNNLLYVEGTNPTYKNTLFRCYLSEHGPNRETLKLEEHLSGYVSGKIKSNTTPDITTIILSNPFIPTEETITLSDINGEEQTLIKKNLICSRCHAKITEEDSKLIWFRLKRNKLKTIYCPICVQQNPNLKDNEHISLHKHI